MTGRPASKSNFSATSCPQSSLFSKCLFGSGLQNYFIFSHSFSSAVEHLSRAQKHRRPAELNTMKVYLECTLRTINSLCITLDNYEASGGKTPNVNETRFYFTQVCSIYSSINYYMFWWHKSSK